MKKKQLVFRPTGEVRLPKKDVPLWRAELRQPYYYFNEMLEVRDYNNNDDYVDKQLYANGNHFQTEQEAEKYAELIKVVLTERLLDNPEFSAMIEKLKGELL